MPASHLLMSLSCASFLLLGSLSATNWEAERRLEEQLAILLPGTGIQQQSARAYAQQRLQELFSDLEADKLRRKSTRRAIHMLEGAVEEHFLQRYQQYAPFSELFKQGHFSQTTATAIYALALEYFNLPYVIRTEPGSVHVLVDPDEEARPLRVREWRGRDQERFQQTYVQLLSSVGMLPREASQASTEQLFAQYYFADASALSLRQLASFLYCEQALHSYQRLAYAEALHWLEQAEALSSQTFYEVLQRAVWLQLAQQSPTSREGLYYLWKIWELDPTDPWETELLRRFHLAANRLVNSPAEASAIDSVYRYFAERFQGHPGPERRLREMYFLKLARYFAQRKQVTPVMNYMDSLYRLQPGDAEVQNVIAGMLVWSLRNVRDYGQGLAQISTYRQRYPFLVDNDYFQDQDLFYRAEQIKHFFDQDDPGKGHGFLAEFQTLLYRYGDTPRRVSWISTAFLSAADYHQRMDEDQRALQLIQSANELAPGDHYLEHMLTLLR